MGDERPDKPRPHEHPGREGAHRGITWQIGSVHLQTNDIDAHRRLAEADLARGMVVRKDRSDSTEHSSDRLSIGTALAVIGMVMATISVWLVQAGVLSTIGIVVFTLAVGVALRGLITVEWSPAR